jgi:hypothetical protein
MNIRELVEFTLFAHSMVLIRDWWCGCASQDCENCGVHDGRHTWFMRSNIAIPTQWLRLTWVPSRYALGVGWYQMDKKGWRLTAYLVGFSTASPAFVFRIGRVVVSYLYSIFILLLRILVTCLMLNSLQNEEKSGVSCISSCESSHQWRGSKSRKGGQRGCREGSGII